MEQSDSLQKTIRQVATRDCYPPIEYQVEAFIPEGKTILAVIVGGKCGKASFCGQAFVRIGSESVTASKQVYEELIGSTNTKAGKILRNKDGLISVRFFELDQRGGKRFLYTVNRAG